MLNGRKCADAVQCEWFGRLGLTNARHPDWPGGAWQSDWLGARACVLAHIMRRAADVSVSAISITAINLKRLKNGDKFRSAAKYSVSNRLVMEMI